MREDENMDIEIELAEYPLSVEFHPRPEVQGWMGDADRDDSVPAYIAAAAMDAIVAHALPVTNREVGGILVGTVHEADGAYVRILGAIAAQHSHEMHASLTFTHQSWQQMLAEKEQRYPGTTVVGWYHTHPGYGIFLSEYDTYIHRNFFDQPYNVAIVVDPCARTAGMFRWKGQRITACPGIALYGEASIVRNVIASLQSQPRHPKSSSNAPCRPMDDMAHEISSVAIAVTDEMMNFAQECGKVIERLVDPLEHPQDMPSTETSDGKGRRIDRKV